MSTVSIPKAGLALGVLMGGLHAVWAALVAVGWAQPFLDFIFRLHFIDPPYHVGVFDLTTAAALVGVTFLLGLAGGGALAIVWNIVAASARPRSG
jgi:hypothetical protein